MPLGYFRILLLLLLLLLFLLFFWYALGKLPLGYIVQILLGVVFTICCTQGAGVLFHGIPKSHSTSRFPIWMAQEWKKNTHYVANTSMGDNVPVRDIQDVDEYNELFARDAFVYDGTRNPFDRGTWRNCLVFWCAPRWTADATGEFWALRVSEGFTCLDENGQASISVIRLKACPWPTGQVSQKLCRFRKLADMAKASLERKTMPYDFPCYMQTVCKLTWEIWPLPGTINALCWIDFKFLF